MELDSYLSPLTSYPRNDPYALIFSRPFERIYDDVYILEHNDVKLLKNRAYLVYDKFSDLIFDFAHYNSYSKNDLNIIIKQFIFYWNKSSISFDIILNYLQRIDDANLGSGKYHLKSSEFSYQIIDLENGTAKLLRFLFGFSEFSDHIKPGSLILGGTKGFHCFEDEL